jgi:hypothetical protein
LIRATVAGNVLRTGINDAPLVEAIDSTHASRQPGIGFFARPAGNSPNLELTSHAVSSN